ncbi:hypothetical protein [Nocardiopsis halophila]|nr:hypothetical protein [Nocardiopsis halophila]
MSMTSGNGGPGPLPEAPTGPRTVPLRFSAVGIDGPPTGRAARTWAAGPF